MTKNYFLITSLLLFLITSCSNYNNDTEKFNRFVNNYNSLENNYSANTERMSESFFLSQLKETKDMLSNLRSINLNDLDFNNQIDYKFIESILVGKEINNEFYRPWEKDPRNYMNFRQISNKINTGSNII